MRRSIARLVALFFLFSAAADLCHPCLEKLESVGLIPDHCQFSLFDSHAASHEQNREQGEESPVRRCGVDDDCFCCRRDVLSEPIRLHLIPEEYTARIFLYPPLVPSLFSFKVLTHSRPPPASGFGLNSASQASKKVFWRLEEVLAEDLLPPPIPFGQSCPSSLRLG